MFVKENPDRKKKKFSLDQSRSIRTGVTVLKLCDHTFFPLCLQHFQGELESIRRFTSYAWCFVKQYLFHSHLWSITYDSPKI